LYIAKTCSCVSLN